MFDIFILELSVFLVITENNKDSKKQKHIRVRSRQSRNIVLRRQGSQNHKVLLDLCKYHPKHLHKRAQHRMYHKRYRCSSYL